MPGNSHGDPGKWESGIWQHLPQFLVAGLLGNGPATKLQTRGIIVKDHSSQNHKSKVQNLGQELGVDDRDLRIEIFAVCESAIDQAGRLSLLGSYERVGSSIFPVVLANLTVVVRLRFWPAETKHNAIRLLFTSPDGLPVARPLEAEIQLHAFDDDRSSSYNLIMTLQRALIEQPGEYTFDFYLNGRLEGRLPFSVHKELV